VYFYKTQLEQILSRPYVAGTMPWILSDFLCPWFLEEHPVYLMNLKGLTDYERNQKAAFDLFAETYAQIEENGYPPAYME
jgi:hypothetical protein